MKASHEAPAWAYWKLETRTSSIPNPPKRILEKTPRIIHHVAVSAHKINQPFKEFEEFSGGRRDGTRQPFTTKRGNGVFVSPSHLEIAGTHKPNSTFTCEMHTGVSGRF
jgi:hypothetical protein